MADTYLAVLNCVRLPLALGTARNKETRLGIFLRRLHEDDQYARIRYNGETLMELDTSMRTSKMLKQPLGDFEYVAINVRQVVNVNTTDYHDRINGFRVATPKILQTDRSGKDLFTFWDCAQWDSQQRLMLMEPGDMARVAYLDIRPQNWKIKVIGLGFDFEFNPVCFVATESGIKVNTRTSDMTVEEHAQCRGIYQRGSHDRLAWSDVRNGFAFDFRQHRGLWALKCDRINGLTVRVEGLADLRITKAMLEDKVVWDVYLENIVKEGTFSNIIKDLPLPNRI